MNAQQKTCNCRSVAVKGEKLKMKSGHLYMLRYVDGNIENIPVFVQLYWNSLEHYAIVCESQTEQNTSLHMNLQNSEVLCSDRDFMVVTEDSHVTFRTLTSKDVMEWSSVFQPISTTNKKKVNRTVSVFSKQMSTITEAFEE
ncbi:hypothetical protein KP79_PYT11263 [Mizuhopecten yessoensis]|uniref:PH domain-containing protein n=1 Tax=Mizuhopecten yessoensis TaxID=6573 RepID=A0A210Q929_MIZYE|nr:hypothetical protein KP79_PYT11263 [Mizuhopecten yessoensis]